MTKAYHVFFSFDSPTTGQLIAIGKDREEAESKFKEHLKGYTNITVHEFVDLDDVPSLKDKVEQEQNLIGALDQFELDFLEVRDDEVIEINNEDKKKVH